MILYGGLDKHLSCKKPDYIPKLYSTDDVPADKKLIYQKWEIPHLGFYWLVAELDKNENLAYGYANLNDDLFAEWGYISIDELVGNNAVCCMNWKPCSFIDAQKKMKQRRRERVNQYL